MTPTLLLSIILGYFGVLVLISFITGKNADNKTFFLANKSAPWYLVAFGMVGASLSGVTFISVPGKVGNALDQMSYLQMVLGYIVGYFFIAYVLLPIYYRMKLTSIYTYLNDRFGNEAYKTGAFYFLLSRTVGASIRLLLVAVVLQDIIFADWGISFEVTVLFSILLIWVYTFRGGIKTIIFTDTLQTAFMLIALIMSLVLIGRELNLEGVEIFSAIKDSEYSKVFFFNDFVTNKFHFAREFLGGIFICIAMTGLDQDMMQKNLACKDLKDAQKNMVSFAGVLGIVNVLFLGLGALMFMYAAQTGLDIPLSDSGKPRTDLLFSSIALDSDTFGIGLGVVFLLGLMAAAYSSADSALTSLTTSVCIDFLDIEKKSEKEQMRTRKRVHIIMSAVLFVVVIILNSLLEMSAIMMVIFLAAFTYGPLLGLFLFGITTKLKPHRKLIPVAAVAAPVVTYLLHIGSQKLFGGFIFGATLIVLNGALMYLFLWILSFIKNSDES